MRRGGRSPEPESRRAHYNRHVATTRTEALILRSVNFAESDRILQLLVPDVGRITVIAKGARRSVKRFFGTLDFFNHLEIQYDQRRSNSMARLDQAVLIRPFSNLRTDPTRFAMGCYLLELMDRLAPQGGVRDETRRLFGFLLRALQAIEARPVDARLRVLLELRALEALGLCPELSRCVRCGKQVAGLPGRLAFSVPDGGPVCSSCSAGAEGLLPVERGTLRVLEQGLRFELDQLQRLVLQPAVLDDARRLLSRFYRFHVGVELRSQGFLDEILSA